jgi:hypothetical protein
MKYVWETEDLGKAQYVISNGVDHEKCLRQGSHHLYIIGFAAAKSRASLTALADGNAVRFDTVEAFVEHLNKSGMRPATYEEVTKTLEAYFRK